MENFSASRFEFLENIFPPGAAIPPLAILYECGKEAEENLHTNTRYCLICLGDIGEAFVNILLTRNNIISQEKEQITKIRVLLNHKIIDEETSNILHRLRIARNNAVHGRYSIETDAELVLDDALKVCEKLFVMMIKPNVILRGVVENDGENFSVSVLKFLGHSSTDGEKNFEAAKNNSENISLNTRGVAREEIAKNDDENFSVNAGSAAREETAKPNYENFSHHNIARNEVAKNGGENFSVNTGGAARDETTSNKKIFRVLDFDGENISLTTKKISSDPWAVMSERYEKYSVGQDVQAVIKSITKSLGAIAELPGGLEARIPVSEVGANYRKLRKKINREISARVKWCDPKKFPYILLSLKEVMMEDSISNDEVMNAESFIEFCQTATAEEVINEIQNGANVNAKNKKGITPIISAAEYNSNEGVITALIDAGANVNTKNNKGNTALLLAARYNTPKVVQELLDGGAEVNIFSRAKKLPGDFALENRLIMKNKEILISLHASVDGIKPKRPQKILDAELIALCNKNNSSPEKINALLNEGANVNARTTNRSTPLMLVAQHGTLEGVKTILSHKPDLNLQNKMGNTALHTAGLHSHPDMMLEILRAGASWKIKNKHNMTAFDIAGTLEKLKNSEAMKFMITHTGQKNFLQICRSGTEQEIQQAIDDGTNINVRSNSGAGALTFAARGNTAGAVEVLLNAGIDPDAQDIHANTALIYAAAYNSDDVVEALIEGGADVNVINNEGRKALDYARQNYRLADTEALKTLEELTQA